MAGGLSHFRDPARRLVPTLSLSRNVTVNGQPAPTTGVSAGVGLTPTIAFEPPSVGAPAYYTVRVL